jgi:hypothetical protein
VCALIVSQAAAQEQRLSAKSRMIRLSTPKFFRERCGANNAHVYACTQFVGQELTAGCTLQGDLWTMQTRAGYLALIYIVRQDFIAHEQMHLRDIEKSVADHLDLLETRTFRSAADCDAAAQSAAANFRAKMQEFAAASNARRH